MDTMAEARAALRDVVPRLVGLVRRIPDGGVASVGRWTAADVAAHLSHVFLFDTDAVAGRPAPDATVTSAGMANLNATMLAGDGERDPEALATRISLLADEFDTVASRAEGDVGWLEGVRPAASAVACHLLEECLIHGHDIARAVGRPWPMRREHTLLAVEGGVLPLIGALPPTAFVDQVKGGSFRGRFALRLRGGGRTVMDFDRGSLTLDTGGRDIDAFIYADPAALMLVFIGRQGIVKPVLGGKIAAWGLRPWKLAGMLSAISPP